jgi:hypothetical protein
MRQREPDVIRFNAPVLRKLVYFNVVYMWHIERHVVNSSAQRVMDWGVKFRSWQEVFG